MFTNDQADLNPLREDLQSTDCVKILLVKITKGLKRDICLYVSEVIKRVSGRLFKLTTLRKFGMPLEDLRTILIGFIKPLLQYTDPVWHPGLTEQQHMALERIQKRACKIILGNNYISYEDALDRCNLYVLRNHRDKICLQFANKLLESPKFRHWLPCFRRETARTLRNTYHLSIQRVRTERDVNSPIPHMVRLWNQETPGV